MGALARHAYLRRLDSELKLGVGHSLSLGSPPEVEIQLELEVPVTSSCGFELEVQSGCLALPVTSNPHW